jgi:hypothetical protein
MSVPREPLSAPVVMVGDPVALGGWWPELADPIVGMTQAPAGIAPRTVDAMATLATVALGVRDG